MPSAPQTPSSSTPAGSSGPVVVNPQTGQVLAPAGALVSNKYNRDLIRKRRQEIRSWMSRGVMSPSKLASAVGVSEETIRRDLHEIRKEDKERLTRKAGPDHVGDLLAQTEQVILETSADLAALKDNTPRAASVRAQLEQTKLRAIALKAELLVKTGVIPTDITAAEKILEAELAEDRIKRADPELASTLQSAQSRRKIMAVIDRLKSAPPDLASRMIDALTEPDDLPPPGDPPPDPNGEKKPEGDSISDQGEKKESA